MDLHGHQHVFLFYHQQYLLWLLLLFHIFPPKELGLDINLHDIGKSHIIGKVKDGKSQVIVRFISYRTRTKVHSNKTLTM
jgi:hypothetical protein